MSDFSDFSEFIMHFLQSERRVCWRSETLGFVSNLHSVVGCLISKMNQKLTTDYLLKAVYNYVHCILFFFLLFFF